MKKFIIPVMVACIAFSGCKSNAKKDKEDLTDLKKIVKDHPGLNAGVGTYSISAPEGWMQKDTIMSGLKLTMIKSPIDGKDDMFRENVTVTTEDAKGFDLKDYTEANRKTMSSQMTGVEFLTKGETTIGSLPAKWFLYKFDYSGYMLKNTVYFMVKNDIGYVITCTALESNFEKFQTGFKTCVNSFTVND